MHLISSSLPMNALYLIGAAAAVYLARTWSHLLLHTIEELRWPGGFVEMVSDKLHFTLASHQFSGLVLASLILIMSCRRFCCHG